MKITLTICLLLAFFASFGQISRSNTFDIRDSMRINSIWYKQLANVTASLSQAAQIPKIAGNTVRVTDDTRGGDFTLQPSTGRTVDLGIVFPTSDPSWVLVRNMASNITINAKWFGMVGDSTTDETAAWKRLRDFFAYHPNFNRLYLPYGKYRITDTALWRRGVYLFGDGRDSSLIVRDFLSGGHGSLGVLTFESKDSNTLIPGIKLEDIGFIGNAQFLGHDQWGHELGLLGTEGAIIRDCKFFDFRGDGIYVGAGSDAAPVNKRKNRNVTVENCIFDGGPKFRNRNAISFIDVDGANVHYNLFVHIGNDTLSRSVGCIDDERNNNNANARRININNNVFKNSMSVNTSAVTLFTTATDELPDVATAFNITENTFDSCFWGVTASNYIVSRPSDGQKMFCNVDKNNFTYNRIAIRAWGRHMSITHNNFKGNATNFNNVQLGHLVGADDLYAQDVEVGFNNFDSCGQNGVIELDNVRNINIHDNTTTNRRSFLYFYIDAGGSNKRRFDHIRVVNNIVNAPSQNDWFAGSLYFLNAPVGFNLSNYVVQSTCTMEGNQLGNRVGLYAGAEVFFNHSQVTHIPTVGTWDAGNELYVIPTSVGGTKIICTIGGTFPIAGDTAVNTFAATNGQNLLVYTRGVNILSSKLREGQYITLTGSALHYKIIGINGTTGLYLDQAYNGTTGSVTATWTAPTFRYQTILTRYTATNGNITITPGNQSSVIEANLTGARSYALGWDTTTLEGVEKVIRNNSTGNLWLTMGNDGVGDTVRLNGVHDSIPIYGGGELHIRSTAANTWRVQNYLIPTWTRNPVNDSISYSTGNVSILNHPFYQGDGVGAGLTIKNRITSDDPLITSSSVPLLMGWTDNSSGNFSAGGFLMKARIGFYFMVNGGITSKMAANVNNLGHWSFNGFTVAAGGSYVDFRNPDSLAIVLPGLSRSKFTNLAPATPGLIAYGPQLDKIVYMGVGNAVKPLLDSATAEGIYQHLVSATYPIQFSGNVISIDTGRGVSQIVTGGDLNKVRDSVLTIINATNAGSGLMFPITSATIGAPAASSTSYYGLVSAVSGTSTPDRNRVYVPINSTLKKVYLFFNNGGTLSSSEASSFYIRVNNTTDFLISNTVTNNSIVTSFNNTAMSISLNAGDYFEVKWVQAAWTTSPTNVRLSAVVWIQ